MLWTDRALAPLVINAVLLVLLLPAPRKERRILLLITTSLAFLLWFGGMMALQAGWLTLRAAAWIVSTAFICGAGAGWLSKGIQRDDDSGDDWNKGPQSPEDPDRPSNQIPWQDFDQARESWDRPRVDVG